MRRKCDGRPGRDAIHSTTADALPDRHRCHEGGPATSVQRLPSGGLKIFFDRPRQEPPPLTSLDFPFLPLRERSEKSRTGLMNVRGEA